MNSTTLPDYLVLADKTLDKIRVHTNTLDIVVEPKEQAAMALLQHAMALSDALVLLISKNLRGPAFTLCRPLLEGYARAAWMLDVADETAMKNLDKGISPKLQTVIKALVAADSPGARWIREMANKNLSLFQDLTHGGLEQILRYVSGNWVAPQYSDDECKRALEFAVNVQLFAASRLLDLANLPEKIHALRNIRAEFQAAV